MSTPSTPPPAGLPSGNGKYIAGAVLMLVAVGAVIGWKKCQTAPTPPPPPDAAVAFVPPPRNTDDDIPLPAAEEDAGPDAGKKINYIYLSNGCEVKKCAGTQHPDMATMLAFRAKAAHKCYDQALSQDATLKGGVTIALRLGTNGLACSAAVASNSTGNAGVAQCIAASMRAGGYPAPKGGCVDVAVPIQLKTR
ncbi:MAG: AgmX/PglI C-terminal domain-containing protein [Myxococcales bacterium]|jgi:hypothetical protein|nr:AgmX/PglI C-terminal domain-containing protein [Myxococcales bacterium]MBL0194106.1 AgmX/PglI C-terminal domain-containing protein [Myxococcales bacterium]HQY60202.1 AgmX/PglI C-terminal domain-containing protein [Polyangiaceae bacterium]